MADGGLTLQLDKELSARLSKAAEAAGSDIGSYAARALDYAIGPHRDWSLDEAIADETLQTGNGIPLADFLGRLDQFGRSAG